MTACQQAAIKAIDAGELGRGNGRGREEHTKPRSRQELCIAGQNHEQVKDVPGIAQISPRATAGPGPQQQLKCEEGIEA